MPETVLIALISVMGTIVVAFIAGAFRRKAQWEEEEGKLTEILRDLVEAQDEKIQHLQALVAKSTEEIISLRKQIEELREVIVNQAIIIDELTKSNNAP